MSPPPRFNRLFGADGRCLVAAIDHGLFGEPSWLPATRDMSKVIAAQAGGGADAMTLTPGPAALLQSHPDPKPALILRSDLTNVYIAARSAPAECFLQAGAVERAVRLDAAGVVAAILSFESEPQLHFECMRNLGALKADCEEVGMPLLIETLAITERDGVPGVSDDPETIATLTRQATEAGADLIKTDPTAASEDYALVVESAAGVPVLVGGGSPVLEEGADPREGDDLLVERTRRFLAAGASGAALGRPIVWAADPVEITRRLSDEIHGGNR